MKKEAVLSELCKARKDISQLRLLLETAIQNQHKIMRLMKYPAKDAIGIPVQDGDKTFEETWGVSPFKNKEEISDLFAVILTPFNPNK